ncbi:MAG TPA: phytanoyl-CoA dioxygenase family protein [Rhizomicrobium sp.]|nr:phytanoyl-CoA dioxygenase family protein [Rhizomicrobium sp.]
MVSRRTALPQRERPQPPHALASGHIVSAHDGLAARRMLGLSRSAAEGHCLEFVRSSHKGTLYNGSAFAADDDTAPLYKQSKLPRLPDIQGNREDFDILSWDLEPGDLIVFHLGVLHGGGGTIPGMRRRTISLRFLGPNVMFDGRPRDEVGAQEGNDAALASVYGGLKHGEPFHKMLGAKL